MTALGSQAVVPDKAKTCRRDTASYRGGARQQIDLDERAAR
jgi:hypothetical protein